MKKPDKNFTDENIKKEVYNKSEDGRVIDDLNDLENLKSMDKKAEQQEKAKNKLIDSEVDISDEEIQDLERSARNNSSDESQLSNDFLDKEDNDGASLNEDIEDDGLLHTGIDLDVSEEDLNPDNDITSEDN